MALPQDEIKRRIHAARTIRGISQASFDALGAKDGFGKGEMSRVERGELQFREGKHLAAICRYLDVPEWWLTAEHIDLAREASQLDRIEQRLSEATAERDQMRGLIDTQSAALREQARVLGELGDAVEALRATIAMQQETARHLERMTVEAVQAMPGPARAPQQAPIETSTGS